MMCSCFLRCIVRRALPFGLFFPKKSVKGFFVYLPAFYVVWWSVFYICMISLYFTLIFCIENNK